MKAFLGKLALSFLVFAVAGEVLSRLLATQYLYDERSLSYAYDENLGWFPVAGRKQTYTGSRKITVEHNSRGFRDAEPGPKVKPRLLFLGDSFVWGYDVERAERFTDRLQVQLPDWEVINLGVSGYGTDQAYLLLREQYDFYQPDVVVLVFHESDRDDNSTNFRYNGYYKPYFVKQGEALELRGIPVPKSINYTIVSAKSPWLASHFLRVLLKTYHLYIVPKAVNVPDPTKDLLLLLRDLVVKRGAKFAVAFASRQPDLEPFCEQQNIPHLDIDTLLRYETHGKHWTPDGQAWVADRFMEFFRKEGWTNP